MPTYVDVEPLIKWCTYCADDDIVRVDRIVMANMLRNAPTVDAKPVRHGHWVHGKELSRDYIGNVCVSIHYDKCWCSECDYPVEGHPLWLYCPNCGAKMDEVEQ